MNVILKIFQALSDANILLKRITKKNKSKTKEQKRSIFRYVNRYFRW